MPLTSADRPALLPGVEVHTVEDGCVVWVPSTNQAHFLNETAAYVLLLCDGERDAASMQAEFGDPDVAGFDVCRGILDQFEAASIIAPAASTENAAS